MNRRAFLLLSIAAALTAGAAAPADAGERFRVSGIEIWTGAGDADLEAQEDLRCYPLAAALTVARPRERLAVQIEPLFEWSLRPNTGWSAGLAGFIRYDLSGGRARPYVKVGTGPFYFTVDTVEQSTRLNFASYFCGGLRVRTGERSSLSVEYRYRHISNAGLRHPNSGVNGMFVMVGFGREL